MIKSIHITNFQSHKSTEIDFSPGLNIISGASDSGKSSILRAMAWVIKNRPSGDAIRNWDCKKGDKISVSITLEDNGKDETLSKERTGSNSRYLSSKFGSLDVIGRDVPEEVTQLLNLSDFGFQTQHDAYFLLNDSPGAIARTLNDLVGLSVIDTIFKNINSKSLAVKRQSEENQKEIDRLQNEISRLEYLDNANNDLSKVELLFSNMREKKTRLQNLSLLITSIKDLQEKLAIAQKIIPSEEDLTVINKKIKSRNEAYTKQQFIGNLIKSINDSESGLQTEKDWLGVDQPFSELQLLVSNFNEKMVKRKILLTIIDNSHNTEKAIRKAIEKINILKDSMKKKIKENGVCPACFRKLDEKTIERMVK